MPCPEHAGIWCSRFFGRQVLTLADAQDATVTRALAMLRGFEQEAEQMAAKARELETRKQSWESRKNAFEQRYQNVDDSQATDLDADSRGIVTDATVDVAGADLVVRDAIQAARDPEGGAAFLTPLLLIPYHDPAGRCPCYRRKIRQLITVQDRINSAQGLVLQRASHLKAQLDQAQLLVGVVSLALTGLAVVSALGVVAFKAAILILLLIVIALLAQIILLLLARRALTLARQRLLKARLVYYRLQHVSTCMLPFPGWDQTEPPGTGEGEPESQVEGYLEELDAELGTPEHR
jgi:hypothetical protein